MDYNTGEVHMLKSKVINLRYNLLKNVGTEDNCVMCVICGKTMTQITNTHLKLHNITVKEYKRRYPGIRIVSILVSDRRIEKMKDGYISGRRKIVKMFGDKNPMKRADVKLIHKQSVQKKNRPDWRLHQSQSTKGRRMGGALKPDIVSKKITELWENPTSVYHTEEYAKKLLKGQSKKWRWTNNRGEKFASSLEMKFADYLHLKNITYELRKILRLGNTWKYPDFFLPKMNLYVEVAGMLGYNKWGYDDKHQEKVTLYKKYRVNCLFIYVDDFKNLDIAFEQMNRKTHITETFHSIMGEGNEIGRQASFVRFSQCNIHCKGCDTAYSFAKGNLMTLREILDVLKINKFKWVFVTGGEPTINPYIKDFLLMLKIHKYKSIIQTNGTVFNKNIFDLCDFISCDIKTPCFCVKSVDDVIINIYQNYREKHQFKLVISDKNDIIFSEKEIKRLNIPLSSPIILQPYETSPLSTSSEEYLENIQKTFRFISEYTLNSLFWTKRPKTRVLPQLHKLIWNKRKGV